MARSDGVGTRDRIPCIRTRLFHLYMYYGAAMEQSPRSDGSGAKIHPLSYQDYLLRQWHEMLVLVLETDCRVSVPGFPLVYITPQGQ